MLWRITKFVLGIKDDNREQYLYNEEEEPLALLVEGSQVDPLLGALGVFDTPNHEEYLHDGTPHRDPAVFTKWRMGSFFGIPYPQRYQERWYSLHVSDDGRSADPEQLETQIENTRLKRGQNLSIEEMPTKVQREVEKVESKTQKARGVPFWNLRPSRSRGTNK